MKRLVAFTATLIACSTAFTLMSARAPAQTAATYVGPETCKSCHGAIWDKFQTSPHHRAEQDPGVVADQVGCEACHGPGSLHAAAAGDTSDAGFHTIRNFRKLSADQANDVCLTCHKTGEQFYWQHGPHARAGVTCIKCHDPHNPKSPTGAPMLTAVDVNALCATCHKDKKASISRTAHMPLREGGMSCVSCHNPHGTATEKQLKAVTVNELCVTCHADKRGPFLWEHAPVRESCLNCHQPHGSNNDKVLASKRPYLCQRCHVATRHPSTLYDKNDLLSNRLLNRACNNCHTQIHGSNHPSGNFFLR